MTDAGGEVTALDSAGYGPVAIDKPVTISSPAGVEASIEAERGADGVTIAGTSAIDVTLRGLTIQGRGLARNGVALTSTLALSGPNGSLTVLDCTVRDFTDNGILVQPKGSGSSGQSPSFRLNISRTSVSNNGQHGVSVTAHNMLIFLYSMSDLAIMRNRVGLSLSGDVSSRLPSYLNGTLSSSHVEMNTQSGIALGGNEVFVLMNGNMVTYNNSLDIESNQGVFALVNRNNVGTLVNKSTGYTDGTNTYSMGPSSAPLQTLRNYTLR